MFWVRRTRAATLALSLIAASASAIAFSWLYPASAAQIRPRSFESISSDDLYFPAANGIWQRIAPADAGWNPEALERVLEYAGRNRTTSFVILFEGRILAERVWSIESSPRYERMRLGVTSLGQPIEDSGSAQKSVVAFLIGIAESKGLIDLAAPVSRYLGNGWSKAKAAAESGIRVRDVMSMTTGLDDSLEYQAPNGGQWRYTNAAYVSLIAGLEKASGLDIRGVTRTWLTDRTGMADSTWATRPWATTNPLAFATTTRDLARFGLLILAGGVWDRQDLLRNPTYLRRILAPSQDLNPSYGLFWWVNGQARVQMPFEPRSRPGSLIPSAPRDLVEIIGTGDRKCYVVPSLRVVVARLGDQTSDAAVSPQFDDELWTLIMKAAPSGRR